MRGPIKKSIFLLGMMGVIFNLLGCAGQPISQSPSTIQYVGSSTIGRFIADAQRAYPKVDFLVDTESESQGGQQAMLTGTADIGGVAGEVDPEILNQGVVPTMIGKDAIAVIVHKANPIANLSSEKLKGIFTGQVTNWKDLGGPDLPVRPLIVGPASATRAVFRERILDGDDYRGCEVVEPDEKIIDRVRELEGAVAQISFSFLKSTEDVKPIRVDGEDPTVTNFGYPIFRPLYLLTKDKPEDEVKRFIQWVLSRDGQKVVMQRFIGANVLASVNPGTPPKPPTGYLIVYTETYRYEDSDIYYYPHLPYDIFDLNGNIVRHVRNHIGDHDERPMTVELPIGKYLIMAETNRRKRPEVLVTITEGKTTMVDIEAILQSP